MFCLKCGNPIVGKRKGTRFCTNTCRQRYRRKKDKVYPGTKIKDIDPYYLRRGNVTSPNLSTNFNCGD